MGRQVGLADLADVHPEVHRSLVALLAMPADAVADLALVFQARQAPHCDRAARADRHPKMYTACTVDSGLWGFTAWRGCTATHGPANHAKQCPCRCGACVQGHSQGSSCKCRAL